MLAKDMREMTEADINAKLAELEREGFNLRVRGGTQTLDDPLRLRVLRKDIARLKTIAHERVKGIVREAASSAPAAKKGKAKAKTGTARRPAKKGATKTKAR